MDALLSKRIELLDNVFKTWLEPGNKELSEAIEATVEEKLFSLSDIKHRLRTLKSSLSLENLTEWSLRAHCNPVAANNKKIVCLHAGNLPMVGLNDFLAVILTGGHYLGKLSSKDPYLLPTLLNKAVEMGVSNPIRFSTDLASFTPVQADAVLFAGSETSVPLIDQALRKLQMIDSGTPLLVRTSHFSLAWIHDAGSSTFESLTEAVFRYGGKGCRSVAIVVAPFSLHSMGCTFTDYVEQFWTYHPQHEKPPASLRHRFAYNKAVGIQQAWLDDFLIEESVEHPEENFILYWVEGGEREVKEILQKFGDGLQSIYSTGEFVGKRVGPRVIEPLRDAQNPPLWWKPDGIDTIAWIQDSVTGK